MLHKQESLSRLKGSSFGSSAETFYRLAVCGVHVNAFIYSSEFWFDKRKRPGSMSNTIPISKWTSWIYFCGFLCLGNVQWHHSVFIYCTPVWETRTGENSIMYFSRFIPTLPPPLNTHPALPQKQVWASVWCAIPASTMDEGADLSVVLMRRGRSECV